MCYHQVDVRQQVCCSLPGICVRTPPTARRKGRCTGPSREQWRASLEQDVEPINVLRGVWHSKCMIKRLSRLVLHRMKRAVAFSASHRPFWYESQETSILRPHLSLWGKIPTPLSLSLCNCGTLTYACGQRFSCAGGKCNSLSVWMTGSILVEWVFLKGRLIRIRKGEKGRKSHLLPLLLTGPMPLTSCRLFPSPWSFVLHCRI